MKERRHHNNKGYRQIKRGKTATSLKYIAKALGVPYDDGKYLYVRGRRLQKK